MISKLFQKSDVPMYAAQFLTGTILGVVLVAGTAFGSPCGCSKFAQAPAAASAPAAVAVAQPSTYSVFLPAGAKSLDAAAQEIILLVGEDAASARAEGRAVTITLVADGADRRQLRLVEDGLQAAGVTEIASAVQAMPVAATASPWSTARVEIRVEPAAPGAPAKVVQLAAALKR